MPVVFEQAAPMAPEIQAAGGAAEQWSKDMPSLARLYETAMQGQTQASIAGSHNATQLAAAQLGESGRDSASANALAEHAREFNQSRQVSPHDVFQAQQQQAMQQQAAQMHAWLQGQELSQAESMRLQRMQNAVGEVQADPNLSDEEKTNLAMQLKTGIDPLRQRVEMQKAKLEQQQVEQAMHANAQRQSMENMDSTSRAAEFQKRVLTIPNPQTGEPEQFYTDHKGDLQAIPFGGGKGGAASEKADAAVMDKLTKYEQHAMDMAMKQQKADLDAWETKRQATVAAGKDDPGPMPGKSDVGTYMKAYLEEMPGYSDLRAQLASRQSRGQAAPVASPGATPQGAAPPPTAPAPPPVVQQGNQPVDTQTLKPLQPFDWTKPDTMAPAQKQWIGRLSGIRNDISGRKDIPEKQRWAAEDAVTDMKELLARHGSYSKMTSEEKAKYDAAERVVARIPHDPSESTGNANMGLGVGGY